MSFPLRKSLVNLNLVQYQYPALFFARFGHKLRGKAPNVAKTLEQRLAGKKFIIISHISKT